MKLTADQIKSIAPDSSSFDAGRSLSLSGRWQNCGQSDRAVWGECQGSGKSPYQIRVDLREFGYRCSCPSRKLPCKHVLGLLLLADNNSSSVPQVAEPDWITQWLSERDDRTQKKSEKSENSKKSEKSESESTSKKVDAKAQLKRIEERKNRVNAGVEQLETWLQDIIRIGIADIDRKPFSFWNDQSKRLVDAQAPGLASKIHRIAELAGNGKNWHERVLGELGGLALLVEAYRKIDNLEKNLQDEIRQQIGWTVDQKALSEIGEKVRDLWLLIGQSYEFNTKIQMQRNWFYGIQSGRFLLYLQFAVSKWTKASGKSASFAETYIPGSIIDAEAVFWSGTGRLRGKFLDDKTIVLPTEKAAKELLKGFFVTNNIALSITNFLDNQAERLSFQPWFEIIPAWFGDTVVCPPKNPDDSWTIQDGRYILPLVKGDYWKMLAISYGEPVKIFGEWDGRQLKPLSVIAENKFYSLVTF
ncbi:MAG: SWIM zinc finger family protein [Planctomycetaceae bacterium]|jgi:hypothetical protein|nr:SWIM zinc finger family protein [Planctomycetaceae bacterium]